MKVLSHRICMTMLFTEEKNKRILAPVFLAIVVLGILLRSVELINGNYLFGHDQGRDYMAAIDIVENHKLRLIGSELGAGSAGISGVFHGPGYLYLVSLMYVLFHGDPYGAIWMVVFFGFLTLYLTYIIGYRIYGAGFAFITLYLTAVSSRIASESRFLWNAFPSSSLILLALYAVYRIKKTPRIFFPAALFIAGSTYHFEMAITVPLVLSIIVYAIGVLRLKDIRTYVYGFISSVCSFLPFFLFELRHGFLALNGLVAYLQNPPGNTLMFHLFILRDHAYDYWYNFTGTFFDNALIQHQFLPIVLAVLLIYGSVSFIRSSSGDIRSFGIFLLLLMAVSWVVMYVLIKNRIWDHYLLHLHSVYIFLFGITYLWFVRQKKHMVVYVYVFFMAVFAMNGIYRAYIVWRYDFFDKGGTHKIAGKKEAIDELYKDASGEPFNVLVFSPAIYTYPYDYLFQWYGKKTYGYVPGHAKEGIVYLLIEPDPSNPYSVQGWKDTVVAGGSVVSTKTLPSGFEIEKRVW